ncbi:conserved hypothetical protein [Pseudoalteromonas luteoviolacea B = ATCC 29581]|nr:conserved hypothetical protein [Pseudoalteromonas luteoviolacea B = ATCC 29581]
MDASASLNSPAAIRMLIRSGDYHGQTNNLALEFLKIQLVMLPKHEALPLLSFCVQNPTFGHLIDINEHPGKCDLPSLGENINPITDVALFHLYQQGQEVACRSLSEADWHTDFVLFAFASDCHVKHALKKLNAFCKVSTVKAEALPRSPIEEVKLPSYWLEQSLPTDGDIDTWLHEIRDLPYLKHAKVEQGKIRVPSPMTWQRLISVLRPSTCILSAPEHHLVSDIALRAGN